MGSKESKIMETQKSPPPPDIAKLMDYDIPELSDIMTPEDERALLEDDKLEELDTFPSVLSMPAGMFWTPLSTAPLEEEIYGEISPRSYEYEEDVEVNSRIQADVVDKTIKYIDRISGVIESIIPDYNYDKDSISYLIEIFSYCDTSTQNRIKQTCKYFSKITDVSRKVVDISFRPGWLQILKNSILLESLTIRGAISPEDLHTFTTLLRVEGYAFLSSLRLIDVNEVAVADILRAINKRFSRLTPRPLYANPSISHSAVLHSHFSPAPALKYNATYSTLPQSYLVLSPPPAGSAAGIPSVSSSESVSSINGYYCTPIDSKATRPMRTFSTQLPTGPAGEDASQLPHSISNDQFQNQRYQSHGLSSDSPMPYDGNEPEGLDIDKFTFSSPSLKDPESIANSMEYKTNPLPSLTDLPPFTHNLSSNSLGLQGLQGRNASVPSFSSLANETKMNSSCFTRPAIHSSASVQSLTNEEYYSTFNTILGSPPPILPIESTYQPLSIMLKMKTMGNLLPDIFSDLLKKSFRKYLKKLTIETQDHEGLEILFKNISFYGCEAFESLVLNNCPLGRRTWDYLARALWPEQLSTSLYPPLKSLSLSNTQLVDGCCYLLSIVLSKNALSSLEHFDLSQNLFTSKGFDIIVNELAKFSCPNLKSLNISNMSLGHNSLIKLFESMVNGIFPLLENFSLCNVRMGEKDCVALSDYLLSDFSKHLITLDISSNSDLLNSLAYIFDSLKSHPFPKLTTLLMDSMNLTNAQIHDFTKVLISNTCTALSTISMKGNDIETDGFMELLIALTNPNAPSVHTLFLSNNNIGSKEIKPYTFNKPFKTLYLKRFELSYNHMTDLDLKYLSLFLDNYSDMEGLQSLILDNNLFTEEGLQALYYTINQYPVGSIKRMDLSNNRLVDSSITLVDSLTLPICSHLEYLHLCDCDFSETDIVYLLKGLANGICPSLISFKLNGNHHFTTKCLKVLLYLWRQNPRMFPNLLSISLCYTSITEQGALLFGEFLRSTPVRLRILDMDHILIKQERRKFIKHEIKAMWKGHVYI